MRGSSAGGFFAPGPLPEMRGEALTQGTSKDQPPYFGESAKSKIQVQEATAKIPEMEG